MHGMREKGARYKYIVYFLFCSSSKKIDGCAFKLCTDFFAVAVCYQKSVGTGAGESSKYVLVFWGITMWGEMI